MSQTPSILNSFWQKYFSSAWKLGILLIFIWGIPRFYLVLQANQLSTYQWVVYIFISMWAVPWIFLSKYGRRKMGLKRPSKSSWLVYGWLLAGLACLAMFVVAISLFDYSIDNWFVYISKSYSDIPKELSNIDRWIYFGIFATTSMIFSPIGEEFFYRGVIHECVATKWGDHRASMIDSAAFAITHLAHFGIIFHEGKWGFHFLSGMIWIILLFFVCRLFYYTRLKSDSIWGAVLAHAGFNFAMSYVIFFFIL